MTCKCKYPTTNCQNIDIDLYCCNKCGERIRPFKKVNERLIYKFRTSLTFRSMFNYVKELINA
jgi:hypothetical protein